MLKLQASGYFTIVDSAKLPQEVKDRILKAGEGKKRAFCVKLIDASGKEITLKPVIRESERSGSLTSNFSFKIEDFDLIEVDDPQLKKAKKEVESVKEERPIDDIATELLG